MEEIMRRVTRRTRRAMLLAVGTWLLAGAASADAQTRRAERWQFSVPITFTFSQSIDGESGSSIDVNNDVGWGFGFGYHVNEKFFVGGEFTWIRAGYEAAVPVDENGDGDRDGLTTVGGALDASNIQAVGQFNLLERSLLTPFVRANLGMTYTDSNIASGPPEGVCWWDPWWGYICGTTRPTYDRTSFSFGGAVGVRADVSRSFFLELSFNGLWVDFQNDTPLFDGIRLNAGWLF